MRFVSTRAHGALDVVMGAITLLSPWLFNFNRGGFETWIPFLLGGAFLFVSTFTDYERGKVRRIPVKYHLFFDLCCGLSLLLSPWLFGFAEAVYVPHVFFGLLAVAAALTTERLPSYDMSNERTI